MTREEVTLTVMFWEFSKMCNLNVPNYLSFEIRIQSVLMVKFLWCTKTKPRQITGLTDYGIHYGFASREFQKILKSLKYLQCFWFFSPFFFSYFVLLFRDLEMRMILCSVNHIVIPVICVKLCLCFQFHSHFEVELILNISIVLRLFSENTFNEWKQNRELFLQNLTFSSFLFFECESVWLSETRTPTCYLGKFVAKNLHRNERNWTERYRGKQAHLGFANMNFPYFLEPQSTWNVIISNS